MLYTQKLYNAAFQPIAHTQLQIEQLPIVRHLCLQLFVVRKGEQGFEASYKQMYGGLGDVVGEDRLHEAKDFIDVGFRVFLYHQLRRLFIANAWWEKYSFSPLATAVMLVFVNSSLFLKQINVQSVIRSPAQK